MTFVLLVFDIHIVILIDHIMNLQDIIAYVKFKIFENLIRSK